MDEYTPDYERLCLSLYAYQFGSIGFLELIELLKVYHLDDQGRYGEIVGVSDG